MFLIRSHSEETPLASQGVQAISITSSYRLTLTLLIADHEIHLLDVGSHDEVYR